MTKKKEDLSALSAALALWRNEASMTQQELADVVGIHVTYIQKIESTAKTKRKPAMDMLIHILAALDQPRKDKGLQPINYNYALELAGYPVIPYPIEWAEVLRELDDMPTINKGDVERIAQEILDRQKRGSINEAGMQSDQGSHSSDIQDRSSSAEDASAPKGKKPPHGGR
jgi:transcriptional regulator with XRE-family HTH domain